MPALRRIVTLVGALLAAAPLGAQQPEVPRPGDRVRVDIQGQPWAVWTLASVDSAALVLTHPGQGTTSVPFDLIRRLDVSMGRKSANALGAGVGAALGGAVGALVGARSTSSDPGNAALGHALIGVAGGALVGALVGSFLHTDRWVPMPLDRLRGGSGPGR